MTNAPHWLSVLPFVLLLLAIATGPVFFRHAWEKHYQKISFALAAVTVVYYLLVLNDGVSVYHSVREYISFIALLSSLFVVTGGILIRISESGTPAFNTLFLFFGAVISNLIGTTGASMLLIRPFLKVNRHRIRPFHIIFFIFTVSNVGGALTPIGDPPLFLGFLRGVPFFWVIGHVWYIWLLALLLILAIFYYFDSKDAASRSGTAKTSLKDISFEFKGGKHLGYLLVILIAVFLDANVIPWIPDLSPLPLGIREIIMFSVLFLAYRTSNEEVLRANEFDFEPIKEVAFLFIGIFFTMIPALYLIAEVARQFGSVLQPAAFYWGSGTLSSFLDNAPTYLNFLSAAMGKFGMDINKADAVRAFVVQEPRYLLAVSVGSVFFGAMTYIGNGPNFMVKSISERAGIKMPAFFAYMAVYSIPVLLPVFTIVWLLFFH